jgi:hypothetical protein
MHKNKIDLERVRAALNTVCPSCGHSISRLRSGELILSA